ncbi:Platelet-derived growth factor C [Willisornis vidua]|uniref:Platelet-derived growth factor C n=1 Tax=Willisornis vidua TaxID=1566151 RepID=A0ABQ9D082_9PASS|nr:Platelet-derived growth factor C [Willisornis vidua]
MNRPHGFFTAEVGLPPMNLDCESEKHQFLCLFAVVDLNLLKEEVRLYSCTPRNFSVSLREELKRTDTIFWPLCLLVKRCGGNCACCQQSCNECQCVPTKVTKKYHEVLQLKPRIGVRGLHKSLTDVPLEHHEECDCVCKGNTEG